MKNIQGKFPMILVAVFVPLAIVFTAAKLWHWPGAMRWPGALMVLLYLLWVLAEMRVTRGEVKKGSSAKDRGTCELYGLVRCLTVLGALAFPTVWQAPGVWMPVGMGLLVAGAGFRLVAIRNLGRFYSHRVRILDGQRVISSGPYKVVRHPAYTGMLVANLGMVVFFFNWVSLVLLVLVFLPAVVRRILVEESNLYTLSGYPAYAKKRYRLIPLVW